MKKITLVILCILVGLTGFAVAGKQQKKNKVKSITVLHTVYENGKPVSYKESVETFDRNGNSTSETEYAKDGTITKKQTAVYDNNQNVTEETSFNAKNNKTTRKAYKYTVMKDKTPLAEEIEYNESGVVVKKTSYTYTASGKKASETVTDGSGNLVSKSLFLYNAKNQKTHKQNFNRSNTLESVKEWQYEYY
jgi:hypothetical protein